jgi:hypothetical protein
MKIQHKMISVYPNPNNGQFVIELDSRAEVVIVDPLGHIVFTQILEPGKQDLDLRNGANGIYLAKINTQFQRIAKKLIITMQG